MRCTLIEPGTQLLQLRSFRLQLLFLFLYRTGFDSQRFSLSLRFRFPFLTISLELSFEIASILRNSGSMLDRVECRLSQEVQSQLERPQAPFLPGLEMRDR